MEELIELLKGCNTRTIEELALLLETSVDDVRRKLEYLENTGIIRNNSLLLHDKGCGSCQGCNKCSGSFAACKGCMPPDVDINMGQVWEVVAGHHPTSAI